MPLIFVPFLAPLVVRMEKFSSTRRGLSLTLFTLAVVSYLFNCLFMFNRYPDLPWYETGIFRAPTGFFFTVGLFLAALWILVAPKDK